MKLAASALALCVLASGWIVRSSREEPSAPHESDPCVEVRAELGRERARADALEADVARLRADADVATKSRIEREREWLRYTLAFSELGKLGGASMPHFESQAPGQVRSVLAKEVATNQASAAPELAHEASATTTKSPATESSAVAGGMPARLTAADDIGSAAAVKATPAPDPIALRSRAVFLALRALFTIEQVTGFDLLEAGVVQDGFVGPIVLRVLDERGRPLGTLCADRLRLEGSRAARNVTIVLENGYERRSGTKVPFEGTPPDADGRGGVRRVALAETNPAPWLEALPELFRSQDRERVIDDGLTNLPSLRAAMNQMLREDSPRGGYRVQNICGAQGCVMRDVTLDQLGSDGKTERRMFADRMTVLRAEKGLEILLEGGSQSRGDQKTPFLDGRYRVFLPRASADAWTKAGVPIPALPIHVAPEPLPEAKSAAAPETKKP